MNLLRRANRITRVISPDIPVIYLRSTGSIIGYAGTQVPQYAPPKSILIRRQASGNSDIVQTKGVNMQGVMFYVYTTENLQSINRPQGLGGDLIYMDGGEWLVERIVENWDQWTKATIFLQVPGG